MTRKVWTAAELDVMAPTEVDTLFDESIVSDLDELPPEFVDRIRARVQLRIESEEPTPR